MHNSKIKHLLLLSSALGAGLGGAIVLIAPVQAGCTSYAPPSNTTVTCSGSVTSGILANSSTSNVTVYLEDGASLSTTRNAIVLSGSGNSVELSADSSVVSSNGTAISLGSSNASDNHLVLYGESTASAAFYAVVLQGTLGSIVLYDSSTLKSTGSASVIAINGNYNSIDLNDSSLVQATGTSAANGIVVFGSGNTITVGPGSSIDANGSAIRISIGSNTIINYGSLAGDLTAITGSNSQDTVKNHGILVGNSGTAIFLGDGDDMLTLATGSSITGSIDGGRDTDSVTLLGSGSEDSNFSNFESLTLAGVDWTLSGTSGFSTIDLVSGNFINNGALMATSGLGFTAPGASLHNHGTLSANITGSSGADTISNYGTITGSIDLSGGNDALTFGTDSSISGSIDGGDGTDSMTLTGSGSEDSDFSDFESLIMAGSEWELSGESSFTSIAVDSGILRLNGVTTGDVTVSALGTFGGAGTIIGNVTSFGTLSAGNSVGTATIIGDLVQEGGSFVEFDASGVDLWDVSGTATLLNSPTLTIASLDGSSTAYGVILHADGGITGSFADPPIYDGNGAVSIQQTANDIILMVVDGTSVVADGHASLQTGMSFFDQVSFKHESCAKTDARRQAPSNADCRGQFWMRGFGQAGNEEARHGDEAFDYSIGGMAAGAEAEAARGLNFGASVGFSSSLAEVDSHASATSIDSIMGAFYSRFEHAGAFITAAFGGAGQSLDLSRTAALGLEKVSVRADTSGWLLGGGFAAGVDLIASGGWTITPSAGLFYLHQWVDGYEEEIGIASVFNDRHDTGLLRLRSSVEARHRASFEGIAYSPHVKLGLIDDIAQGGVATGSFSSGTAFELSLSDTDRFRWLAGIGIEAEFDNGSIARLAYEGEASQNSIAHALMLEVKVIW